MGTEVVSCRLEPRRSAEGHPFTEILMTWREGDEIKYACSRVNYSVDDSPHARAYQIQQFLQRRQR